MKKFNVAIYCLLGAGAILYGAAALLIPAVLVSEAGQSFHVRHILREEGAAAIFIGLMSWWCIFNYGQRRAVHYFLIVFAALIAAIHWFDYLNGYLPWMSPLYNTIPLAVLLIMTLFVGHGSKHEQLTVGQETRG